MSGKYDDIIDLPHPEPQTHPRMPMRDRAAEPENERFSEP